MLLLIYFLEPAAYLVELNREIPLGPAHAHSNSHITARAARRSSRTAEPGAAVTTLSGLEQRGKWSCCAWSCEDWHQPSRQNYSNSQNHSDSMSGRGGKKHQYRKTQFFFFCQCMGAMSDKVQVLCPENRRRWSKTQRAADKQNILDAFCGVHFRLSPIPTPLFLFMNWVTPLYAENLSGAYAPVGSVTTHNLWVDKCLNKLSHQPQFFHSGDNCEQRDAAET